MAKEPANVFLKNVPKGQLPDNITVDTGEDLIEAVKYYINKDRYSYLKRGQKPADKKDWVRHSFGIPVSKSKSLRLYIYDKPKEEKIRDLESKVWKKDKEKQEVHDLLIKKQREVWELKDELQDLQKTVVEQRQKILELTPTPVEKREDNPVQTVCLRQYEIEITYCPIRTKYNYKIWDGENDRYVHEGINFLNTIDATVAEAKWEIEEREEKHYEYW